MINKDYGGVSLVCDCCSYESKEVFIGFYEAIYYKELEGWQSVNTKNGWEDRCPSCAGYKNEQKN